MTTPDPTPNYIASISRRQAAAVILAEHCRRMFRQCEGRHHATDQT